MSLVVMVTLPPERALDLARILVAEHLAGCVNIVPGLQSVYRWQGEVAEDPESLLLIKTSGEQYPDLEARIKAVHPYEVPEIIALQYDRALPEFQAWLRDSLTPPQR
ncbi:divalent-cation tolerance protein CutA [Deinococcus sp. JMULE3]|uniref:divalent-cation tolerance protein CutA n=1 Tax=Deinococcus sp. JMULE3 TaxID=2518341 RepID=UPI001576DABC|nr:divalent-cation tolerance protein CutA [Deinococcus sp. JMULE3]